MRSSVAGELLAAAVKKADGGILRAVKEKISDKIQDSL